MAYGTLASRRLHEVTQLVGHSVLHLVVNNAKKIESLQLVNGNRAVSGGEVKVGIYTALVEL